MGLWDIPAKHEICDTELRFNPYHDPTTGRFTTAGGGSGGGYLYVGKGQKGKGAYVFERDIDSEYNKWKAQKQTESIKSNDIHSKTYNNPDEYKSALAEKYNGITDVSKIKSARDVSDFINYDTQSHYYASTNPDANGNRKIKSTWDRRIGEIPPVRDAGFSSNGTTVFDMPKDYSRSGNRIYDDSIAKLNKAGIRVGRWYDDKYMVTKKPRVRTSKWLEGTSKD